MRHRFIVLLVLLSMSISTLASSFTPAQELVFLDDKSSNFSLASPRVAQMSRFLKAARHYGVSEENLADKIERARQVSEKNKQPIPRIELAEAAASLAEWGRVGVTPSDALALYLTLRLNGSNHSRAQKGAYQFLMGTTGGQKP